MSSFNASATHQQAFVARERMRDKMYQHFKGGVYKVWTVAVDEHSGEIVVVYESMAYGYVWTRPLEEFEELVKGMGVPRFRLVEGT